MVSLVFSVLVLCVANVWAQEYYGDDNFLLGEQRGLQVPDFVVDENLEIGGKAMESCTRGDKNSRWKGESGNKHCYMLFVKEPKTWMSAKRHCESLGGYLATVTSDDEQAFLTNRFQFADLEVWDDWVGPWIGYTDGMKKGTWQWVSGEIAVVGQDQVYNNWFQNVPDNCCGGEDCAQISGGHWGDKWNDNKCHFKLPYLCERDK